MSNLTENNWAYLAGFLDADGSVYVRLKPNETYRYGFQIAPSIVFFQSNKEERKMNEMQKRFGIGYIRHRKDGVIEWTIGDEASIRLLIINTLPYVELKRAQCKLMLNVLNQRAKIRTKGDMISLSKKIDKFKELNYSKKRKIDSDKVIARLKLGLDIKIKKPN